MKTIKQLLRENNLTQSELASIMGLSLQQVQRKLNGKTEISGIELQKISVLLKVHPLEIDLLTERRKK